MRAARRPLREIARLPTPAGPVVVEATDAPGLAVEILGAEDTTIPPFLRIHVRMSAARRCRRPVIAARLLAGGVSARPSAAGRGHRGVMLSVAGAGILLGIAPGAAGRVVLLADGLRLESAMLDAGESADITLSLLALDRDIEPETAAGTPAMLRPYARAAGEPAAPWREAARVRTPRGLVVAEASAVRGLSVSARVVPLTLPPFQPQWEVDGVVRIDVVAEARRDAPAHGVRVGLHGIAEDEPDPGGGEGMVALVLPGAAATLALACQDEEAHPDAVPAIRHLPMGLEVAHPPMRRGEARRTLLAIAHVRTGPDPGVSETAVWSAVQDALWADVEWLTDAARGGIARLLQDVAAAAVELDRQADGGRADRSRAESPVLRVNTWRELRGALERLRDGDPAFFAAAAPAKARAWNLECVRRLVLLVSARPDADRGELDRATAEMDDGGGGDTALVALAMRALVFDDLRRMNDDGLIAGEIGWAARRRAWAGLHRAVRRLEDEEPALFRRVVAAADDLRPRLRRGR